MSIILRYLLWLKFVVVAVVQDLVASLAELLAGLAPGAVAGAPGLAGVDGVRVRTLVLRDLSQVGVGQPGAGLKVGAAADADGHAAEKRTNFVVDFKLRDDSFLVIDRLVKMMIHQGRLVKKLINFRLMRVLGR